MPSFTMPAFSMPLPKLGVSSGVAAAEEAMWPWLDRHHLIANESMRMHLVRTRPHYTAAVYYPHAHAEQLVAPARYTAWAFIVDDVFDDAISAHDEAMVAEFSANLIDVARGEVAPSNDAGRALAELLDALSVGRSRGWRALLGEANARWLQTYVVEVRASRAGRTMRFNEYLPHRRYGTDELFYMHVVEYAHGIELPAEVRDLPAMVEVRDRGLEWIGAYNDIISADKEEAVGYLHNAVLVVREQRSCSMQEAVDTVNEVLTGLIAQFQAACAAVPGQIRALCGDEPAVRNAALQVVEGYRHLVRGNFDYHVGTPRYDDVPSYMPSAQAGELRPDWATTGIFRPTRG